MGSLKITALSSLAGLASLILAAPQPIPEAETSTTVPPLSGTEGIISPTLGTAIHGALNDPIPTEAARLARDDERLNKRVDVGPEYLTIQIINSHGDTITTSHARNAGSPTAVGGAIGPGIMTNGETAAFAVPTGWAGNVAINDAGWSITGDDSLLEASYVVADGYDFAVADVDISYVNGFSVAITCECSGTWVAGCNKNLFKLNTCSDNDGENACVNSLRADTSATSATTFFAPCEGAAYTFPNDNAANVWGSCQSGLITCCVGASCPASILQ
ncbi:hypothetical protein VP1G_09662 [Cytospora mali]|uniref:Uncharacterized protein n=1 Tax=Cytospora mali TaxID=578113 RepID=A0A194VFJ6_CYTMA|nr:hypothetical protein VP1G_09662 [Valsa mali var. pyri (nom. inval.)]